MSEAPPGQAVRSHVVRREAAGGWQGVPALPYAHEASRDDAPAVGGGLSASHAGPGGPPLAVTRWLLAGGPASACAFELRYFELGPGARTSHERHRHQHAVVVLRGRGEVLLGEQVHGLGPGDLVRIAPGEPHQFRNPAEEPFGFLCVVDADRDRPVRLDDDDAPSCGIEPG